MLVQDLDGNSYQWKPRGIRDMFDSNRGSGPHKKARQILKSRFPTLTILEEVSVKIRKKKTLFFDFYIPSRRVAIEVNGEQHYKYNSKFHSSKADFIKQKKNDREKAEWCELNGIQLIELDHKEEEQWEQRL